MLKGLLKKTQARKNAREKARNGYTSWKDISHSTGWRLYEEKVNKKIEVVRNKIESDTTLTGEDLKRLQLALQVWKDVLRIPKEIEENAKAGGKNGS